MPDLRGMLMLWKDEFGGVFVDVEPCESVKIGR